MLNLDSPSKIWTTNTVIGSINRATYRLELDNGVFVVVATRTDDGPPRIFSAEEALQVGEVLTRYGTKAEELNAALATDVEAND